MTFRKAKKRYKNGTYWCDDFWKLFAAYAKEKQVTPEEKLKHQREKCREVREVKTCKKCLRYAECYEGKPSYDKERMLTRGEQRLGLAIICAALEDYKSAWKEGEKNNLNTIKKWLHGEEVTIFSCGEYNGIALEEGAYETCCKLYGPFEIIYEKKQAELKAKLKSLEREYKNATDSSERKNIGIRIAAIKGRLFA